ncbi:hypothetical protein OUZ56_007612 [Daphnia magna]|uniref:Uncharacterized protein n=1 Tax=Daphnia magna TaxID=35525 RepID=A0ABR0AAI4_9CRUS|nr:hypothetical protein OUZ56_007612 [Daphnia magna]
MSKFTCINIQGDGCFLFFFPSCVPTVGANAPVPAVELEHLLHTHALKNRDYHLRQRENPNFQSRENSSF